MTPLLSTPHKHGSLYLQYKSISANGSLAGSIYAYPQLERSATENTTTFFVSFSFASTALVHFFVPPQTAPLALCTPLWCSTENTLRGSVEPSCALEARVV